MSNRLRPVVGHWYSHLDKGDLFQVVALDAVSGTIEIQEFDGALDELDIEEWRQLQIESAAAPEDWSGPVDEMEPDDLGYTDLQGEERREDLLESASTPWDDAGEDEFDPDLEELRPPLSRRQEPPQGHRSH